MVLILLHYININFVSAASIFRASVFQEAFAWAFLMDYFPPIKLHIRKLILCCYGHPNNILLRVPVELIFMITFDVLSLNSVIRVRTAQYLFSNYVVGQ